MDSKQAWLVVVGSILGVAVCSTPVAIISLSAYIKPLHTTFGWGRGQITLALSLITLVMAVVSPFAGRLIDRIGVRPVLITSFVLYAVSLAALPLLIGHGSLTGFYIGYAIVGVVGAGSNTVAYVHAISGWFDRYRGLAMGIAMSGLALGAAGTPALSNYLMSHYGWAAGFYGLAALPVVIGLPAAIFLIKECPVRPELSPAAAAASSDTHLTVKEALKTRSFWTMLALFFFVATCVHGIQIHFPSLVTDAGFSPAAGVAGVAILFIFSAFARVLAGFLLDLAFAPFVAAGLFALACGGVAALLAKPTLGSLYACAALVGVGAGAETDILGYLISRYFGRKAFGAIYGLIFGSFMVGSAAGPYFFGLDYDLHGSYKLALIVSGLGLAFACVLLLTLPRFKFVRPSYAKLIGLGGHAEPVAIEDGPVSPLI
ncbi:MAG: MFS transporter [Caulobacteraceae bacterium]